MPDGGEYMHASCLPESDRNLPVKHIRTAESHLDLSALVETGKEVAKPEINRTSRSKSL